MMSWDAIGALALFATLSYLAAQIRQNSRMMVANIRELRMGATQQIILKWADDPELLAKVDNGESLTDVEKTRALMIIRSVFRNWESHDH